MFSLANCAILKSAVPDDNWLPANPADLYFTEKDSNSSHLSNAIPTDRNNNSSCVSLTSRNLLLHSFFNLFLTHYCSAPFFKSLFSSLQRIFITIFSNSSFEPSTNMDNTDIRSYSDPIIEAIALVSLETMNAQSSDSSESELEMLQKQAENISKKYPIGSSLFKIMKSRLLMKQLYYTMLNDLILVLFPELSK